MIAMRQLNVRAHMNMIANVMFGLGVAANGGRPSAGLASLGPFGTACGTLCPA